MRSKQLVTLKIYWELLRFVEVLDLPFGEPHIVLLRYSAVWQGFKSEDVPSVTVAVTETPVLNRSLQLGAQTEQVTVEANVATIQTATATMGTVVASQAATALPLTTRNYTNLLGLSAGTNASVPNATSLGRGNMEIAVNGASTNQNTFQMDGVSIVNYGSSGALTEVTTYATFGIPNPDTLEEFKIQTSLYDAGYGRNVGANVNVITKSGTNSFHGTAFEFFRNTDLNANDFFRNRTCGLNPALCASAGGNKLVLNQNQFGGVFGGPIKKDKFFFFTSYQQTWQKNGQASQGYAQGANLPVMPNVDRNSPAFQTALGALYCNKPTSVGGVQVACDGSNINPIALEFLRAKLPDGTYFMPQSSSGAVQPANYSIPAYDKEYQGLLNLDYVVNPKHTIASRFFKSQEPQSIPFATSIQGVPGTTESDPFFYDDGVLKLTSILSNSVVNELRGSVQRAGSDPYQSPPPSTYASNIYPGIQPGCNLLTCAIPYSPVINITGVYTAGGNSALDETVHDTQWQIADQVSWIKGKQTIRMGFELERVRWGWLYKGLSRGIEVFQTFSDFLVGLPGNCGPAVPGACNGSTIGSNISNTTNFDVRTGPGGIVHSYRAADANAFIQDDIKFSQRLTLNLGVRWEYDGLPTDKYGNTVNLWSSAMQAVPVPATTAVAVPGVYSVPPGATLAGWVVPTNFDTKTWGQLPPGVISSGHQISSKNGIPLDNFAPRLGVAWQPFGNRLVLRGGFGFFWSRVDGNTIIHSIEQSPPYAITLDQSGIGNSFASEAAPFQPIPLGVFPARWVNFTPGLNAFQESSGLAQSAMFDHFVTPLVYSWNFNAQYQIGQNWVAEVGYVGSEGIHQPETLHLVNEAGLASPSNPINGITSNTVTNALLRVPYLGFSPTGVQWAMTDGTYRFNSLQATLRKQFSYGLTFQAAYTFSRAFSNLLQMGMNSGDPLNGRQQFGLNTAYRPQRLTINYSYDLPGRTLKGFAGKALGGWSLSGVTTIQDGQPLIITDNRGGSIFGMNLNGIVIRARRWLPAQTYSNIPSKGGVEGRLGGASGGCGYFDCSSPAAGGNIGTTAGGFTAFTPLTCGFDAAGHPTAGSLCVGADPTCPSRAEPAGVTRESGRCLVPVNSTLTLP
ncbi:MAG: TonB-dependent receptor [Acidobacteriia bacterium]|nr:TonB-dependent receptor [Terriglobia bacterium]